MFHSTETYSNNKGILFVLHTLKVWATYVFSMKNYKLLHWQIYKCELNWFLFEWSLIFCNVPIILCNTSLKTMLVQNNCLKLMYNISCLSYNTFSFPSFPAYVAIIIIMYPCHYVNIEESRFSDICNLTTCFYL